MKFHYTVIDSLPPLAWLARISGEDIDVLCGERVERTDAFFVEGAWAGAYTEGLFDEAEWLCGSGARLRENDAVFAAPTGMHAGLYYLQENGRVTVCNSLPFLMAEAGYEFDPAYIGYDTFFQYNILQGIHGYKPDVPVRKAGAKTFPAEGTGIRMRLFRNRTVSRDGAILEALKPDTEGFDCFEAYYARLVQTMKALTANAQDPARRFRYGVTSFISSGYDAACCSAVAKEAGADKVMTFAAIGRYAQDSGVGAARQLGYETVIERDAYAYKSRDDFPEIVYLGGGDIGTGISFSSFVADCRGCLVYSGENGDFVWSRPAGFQSVNDDVHIVWKNSEVSLWESHLHQGYIPVPMTNYGIRHWTDLYRISNSEAMDPWSVGGGYDRPIPRRILEEKGLARDSFGHDKRGAGFFYAYDWKRRILRRMSPRSAESFSQYVAAHRSPAPLAAILRYCWANRAIYTSALLRKLGLAPGAETDGAAIEKRNSIPNPFAARYLIPWAGERVIAAYRDALGEQKK